MMRWNKNVFRWIFVAALSASLVGCGGDADADKYDAHHEAHDAGSHDTAEPPAAREDASDATEAPDALEDAADAPVVTIDAPEETMLYAQEFPLKAAIEFDGALIEHHVSRNDSPVEDVSLTSTTSGYQLEAIIPLLVGANDISVEVIADNGERGEARISITRAEDTEAPTLSGLSPHYARSVLARRVMITGQAADNLGVASVTLSVGDTPAPATLSADGRFSAMVDLAPGPNAITVAATDAAGNQAELSHALYFGAQTAAGGAHSGVLLDSEVYAWGRNNRGQVGLGYDSSLGDTDPAHPVSAHHIEVPGEVISIVFSQNSSFALNAAGEVYAWGDNADGQLCLGEANDGDLDETHRYAPEKVDFEHTVVAIARGYDHTLLLTDQGKLYACGDNADGQLGDGTTTTSDTPVEVIGLEEVIAMTASSSASYALTKDGDVFAWGDNADGNLGLGTSDRDPHSQPTKIDALADIVEIAAGKDHALALNADGQLYGWGLNRSAQVGPEGIGGFEDDVLEPTLLSPNMTVTGVLAGANQSFVYGDNARVYGWGQNGFGNLGIPSEEDLTGPVEPVFGVENLVDVTVGALHSVALRADGRVFAWGWSFQGSLGAGESSIDRWSYRIPVLVEFAE